MPTDGDHYKEHSRLVSSRCRIHANTHCSITPTGQNSRDHQTQYKGIGGEYYHGESGSTLGGERELIL